MANEIPQTEPDESSIEMRDRLQDWPAIPPENPAKVQGGRNGVPKGAQPFKSEEEKAQEAQEARDKRLNRGND